MAIIGYWFAAGDTLPHGDDRRVVIGETLTVEPPIIPCKHGLHASVDPFDALQYAPRGCRAMAAEVCRIVFAMQARMPVRHPRPPVRDGDG